MRIALLTLEALANARAVRRFVHAHAAEIALVGLSDPYRPAAGGALGQMGTRLRGSGPRFLPYLTLNFGLPRALWTLPLPRNAADPARVPLPAACRALGIPTTVVADVNGASFRQALARSGAEILLSYHFDQILSADTIASVPRGGVNVHAGLLPRHRGPVPTLHALLDDPVAFGVTVHRLAPRIDAGAILAQATIPDEPGLTALGAAGRLHEAALPLVDRVLAEIAAAREAERTTGLDAPVLPYRGFPTQAEMTRLARSGRRAAGWSDLREVWRLR